MKLITTIIAIFIVLGFALGAILPWVISNDSLPLWLDLIILIPMFVGCTFLINYAAKTIIKAIEKFEDSWN